jgi:hypothetical protein
MIIAETTETITTTKMMKATKTTTRRRRFGTSTDSDDAHSDADFDDAVSKDLESMRTIEIHF